MTMSGTIKDTIRLPVINPLNRNVLIIGSSGAGKSLLLREVERVLSPELKLIFKSDGEKCYNVSLHRPYYKNDRVNFLDAWQESLKIDTQGYMILQSFITLQKFKFSDQTLVNLKTLISDELKKDKDILELGYLSLLDSRLNILYPPRERGFRDFEHKITFEDLSEDEYLFFSDYLLRMKYGEILNEIISIDEIHRLRPLMDGLISRITREIRSRGGLLCTSQSLSDLPPALVNNFGTIFCFNTIDLRDLQFFEKIDPDLKDSILHLEDHEFLEIRTFKKQKKLGHLEKMIYHE